MVHREMQIINDLLKDVFCHKVARQNFETDEPEWHFQCFDLVFTLSVKLLCGRRRRSDILLTFTDAKYERGLFCVCGCWGLLSK